MLLATLRCLLAAGLGSVLAAPALALPFWTQDFENAGPASRYSVAGGARADHFWGPHSTPKPVGFSSRVGCSTSAGRDAKTELGSEPQELSFPAVGVIDLGGESTDNLPLLWRPSDRDAAAGQDYLRFYAVDFDFSGEMLLDELLAGAAASLESRLAAAFALRARF